MTLIFTNPLFTMLFAACFMGHRLSTLKIISTIVLMAGIILVTKPPFLFPDNNSNGGGNHSVPSNISLTWQPNNILGLPLSFDQRILGGYDPADYYFVGALIALS